MCTSFHNENYKNNGSDKNDDDDNDDRNLLSKQML